MHKALILMILFIRGTKNRLDANLIAGGAGLFWLKNCHEGKKIKLLLCLKTHNFRFDFKDPFQVEVHPCKFRPK